MSAAKNWRQKAFALLDQYELSNHKDRLTQVQFAELLGISRQTLWRDEVLMERFHAATSLLQGQTKRSRRDSVMRIRQLETQLEELREENNRLIQLIVEAARQLTEHGIDPRLYLGDATR